ncbi:indole-3-glycerol phosphate synthase TrpC [Ferviditalea candida]|uniref:Indole-3-glycerol phosphate synthase n=1 Tax=Ferviditalea candida TaxID=3108399 RepID=A0ABU5ZQT1_9BACL|nr:indole-3-glycerol phosphate synthase TrpC [Paenibacillaceae bacterium T2]
MFLDRIVATKRAEVEQLKEGFSLQSLEKELAGLPPARGFAKALGEGRRRPMGLIAEVKKASPSKGLIRSDFDPVEIARSYAGAQTDCISVLTDATYFQGSNDYLRRVREAVDVPVLRKDFTIDYRQIYEARQIGADAILLIAAILSDEQLREFLGIAKDLGLDALVEVHDREELERVLEMDVALLGINNRDLKSFVTDLKTTENLIRDIPKDRIVVSESGISTAEQIAYLSSLGAGAVLVGEHFMRQADIGRAVHDLMGFSAVGGVS